MVYKQKFIFENILSTVGKIKFISFSIFTILLKHEKIFGKNKIIYLQIIVKYQLLIRNLVLIVFKFFIVLIKDIFIEISCLIYCIQGINIF